jgi:hypothetical protein
MACLLQMVINKFNNKGGDFVLSVRQFDLTQDFSNFDLYIIKDKDKDKNLFSKKLKLSEFIEHYEKDHPNKRKNTFVEFVDDDFDTPKKKKKKKEFKTKEEEEKYYLEIKDNEVSIDEETKINRLNRKKQENLINDLQKRINYEEVNIIFIYQEKNNMYY